MPSTDDKELSLLDAWWRAANYLAVGQIYLLDNPLLKEPLTPSHIKPRLLGHWGTSPGLTLLYGHLNRVIRERDVDMIFVTGPGHGGPALVAAAWLDGTYSEVYPEIGRDEDGMRRLFRQFSFPGGIPSHVAPETPGSIHEGGELGYSLTHAYGAAFDNPDLVVACVIGDGEAETGPLAASWHSNKFLDPVRDGTVLPILHLNGYKIANPTVLARIPEDELRKLLEGYGHRPWFVEGSDPAEVHQALGGDARRGLRRDRRRSRIGRAPAICAVPRGRASCCGPRRAGPVRRSSTVSRSRARSEPIRSRSRSRARTERQLRMLEDWLRSYRPEELFDEAGIVAAPTWTAWRPAAGARMSANPHTNGGELLRDLRLPDFRAYAVDVPTPGSTTSEAARVAGVYLRDVVADEPRQLPGVRPGRDRIEPARGHLRRDRPSVDGADRARATTTWHRTVGSWRCCPSICAKAGSRATCSPGATACSTATRRSSTSSTRCSTSMRSGSRSRTRSPGAGRSRHSTTSCRATSGGRTTTGSAIRIPVSSTTWSTRRPRSPACTCRPTRTRCSPPSTTACGRANTST